MRMIEIENENDENETIMKKKQLFNDLFLQSTRISRYCGEISYYILNILFNLQIVSDNESINQNLTYLKKNLTELLKDIKNIEETLEIEFEIKGDYIQKFKNKWGI